MNTAEKGILGIGILLVMLAIATGSASANCIGDVTGTVFGCGDTVFERCTLDGDMDCGSGHGLIVGEDGITINGYNSTQGEYFKITGGKTLTACVWISETNPCADTAYHGIYNPGYDNVVIRNLEIENFCTGIWLYGTGANKVGNNTVDNCTIHDNGFNTKGPSGSEMVTHGIHAANVEAGLNITNNDLYNNEGTGGGCGDGGNGIFIYAGSPESKHEYCNISYNKLHDNAKAGFWTKMMLTQSEITHNDIWGSGGGTGITDDVRGGIILRCKKSDDNLIAYNNVSGNLGAGVGYGIFVGGKSNIIRNNTVNDNTADGICLGRSDGSFDNQIRNNTVCRNDRDGIHVVSQVTGNVLYDNYVCDNSGKDIYDGDDTVGDDNTCNTAYNYHDASAANPPYCVYPCPGAGPDLVTEKSEAWVVEGENYTITYTVTNVGNQRANASNTGIYINGVFKLHDSVQELDPDASHTNTLGPFDITGPDGIDTILVCADDLGNVTERNEENNCTENVFGGPDLVIIPCWDAIWIDPSWKTYNLSYTVKNVGDIATPAECWTNFTELHGEWRDCVDPVPIPAGLDIGQEVTRTAGPFVMEGDADWLELWVNFNHTFPENVEDNLHDEQGYGNRGRFNPAYADSGGSCKECGDVDCSGGAIDFIDVGMVFDAMFGGSVCCQWAADADCSGGAIDFIDVGMVFDAMFGGGLDCCKGGCAY